MSVQFHSQMYASSVTSHHIQHEHNNSVCVRARAGTQAHSFFIQVLIISGDAHMFVYLHDSENMNLMC